VGPRNEGLQRPAWPGVSLILSNHVTHSNRHSNTQLERD
jgi:hypothetical protein